MRKPLLLSLFFSFVFFTSASAGSLYNTYNGKGTVKVHVSKPTDSTTDKKADLAGIKAEIEKKLKDRKSITFQTVDSKEDAGIAIDADIKEFFWSNHDPVDMIVGIGAAAMDAAVQENYSRMQAVFTVTDVRTKKVIWQEKVMATITSKTMTEKDSVPMMSEDVAKAFVKRAFAKQRK